jgi:SAM-dependent methyltransferase
VLDPVVAPAPRAVGGAVAALVRGDDPEAGLRQRRDLPPPRVPELREAVEQDDERPGPGLDVVQVHAADVGGLVLEVGGHAGTLDEGRVVSVRVMPRSYDTLASVYDFLMPDDLLDPAGSFAAFAAWVEGLPAGAQVLDCACGPGHLAVGLAQAGFAVTATDASPAMTSRAAALAQEHGVALTAEPLAWAQLGDRGWDGRFSAVFCVGNSLTHAEGAAARRDALGNMAAVLAADGRLIVTSRNWEDVRLEGSGLSVDDRLVTRDGRRGLVIRHWTIAPAWTDRHRMDVAVALLDEQGGDAVHTVAEHLTFWPFRHEELLDDLAAVGLEVETTTYAPDAERYLVTAKRSRDRSERVR